MRFIYRTAFVGRVVSPAGVSRPGASVDFNLVPAAAWIFLLSSAVYKESQGKSWRQWTWRQGIAYCVTANPYERNLEKIQLAHRDL